MVAHQDRILAFDAFRYIAFMAVVVLHCLPSIQNNEVCLLGHATRFAVPFFFVLSGYLLGLKDPEPISGIFKIFKRLAPIFLIWVIVYVACTGSYDDLSHKKIPYLLMTGGPGFHLWFLPALGLGLSLLLLFKRLGIKFLIIMAAGLYVVGLAFGPYATLLHLPDIHFNTRNGPFFGFPLIVTGYYIAKSNMDVSFKAAVALMMGGFVIQIAEAAFLADAYNQPFQSYDYLLGTWAFGTGVFLAVKQQGYTTNKTLASLGSMVLGMYCVHVLFIWLFETFLDNQVLWQNIVLVGLVVFSSTAFAWLLSKLGVLRVFYPSSKQAQNP